MNHPKIFTENRQGPQSSPGQEGIQPSEACEAQLELVFPELGQNLPVEDPEQPEEGFNDFDCELMDRLEELNNSLCRITTPLFDFPGEGNPAV